MYFLRKYKYDITTVIDGNDAVEIIKNNNFDLILMDIMLPGMNGFEITNEIRKLELVNNILKPVIIIALTAATYNNDRDKCISAGMDDYLSKPFTAEQLNYKIKKFF